MKTPFKDQLSTPQAAVIIINYILGTGILTLPRTSVEVVGTPDVWITVILGGLITMTAGIIMVKLCQQFPEKTFYYISQVIVGKWVGGLLCLVVVCYFFISSAFQIRSLVEVTGQFLLEGTPDWAIMMVFMWVGLYLIIGGINPIARLFEIILPITIIIFLFAICFSFGIFDVNNVRPVLGDGIIPVLKGIKTTSLAYTGIEIILIIMAFMQKPGKAVKAVLIGTLIPMIIYVITVVMVIGALSINGVVTRTWPTLDLLRSFEIKGLLFERIESLLLVIWVMQIFSTFTITFYAAALGLAQLFKKSIVPFIFAVLPIIFIIAMLPQNINDLFKLGDFIGFAAIILFAIIPPIFLLISKWRGGN